MILVDFSSIIHRKVYTAVSDIKPTKVNGKLQTSEFVKLLKFYIFKELFEISQEFGPKFGDIVICLDNKSKEGYWRKDVYHNYKAGRSKGRADSEINFQEVWPEVNAVIDCISNNLPWKTLDIHRAEADDTILILAELFSKDEIVLIHSPDKDMIQAQIGNDNVKQYSALTKKWLVAETKSGSMDEWILEHIVLGDASDEVPKVVDNTDFSDSFKDYLNSNLISKTDPWNILEEVTPTQLGLLVAEFDVWRTNRKGEKTVKDVYKEVRFGPGTLKKIASKCIDEWLDSHPLYRKNYERNKILVLTEGIPDYIREDIVKTFIETKPVYKPLEFEQFIKEHELDALLLEFPPELSIKRTLTAEDFGW